MRRAVAIAVLVLAAMPAAARDETAPRLVRFTSERLVLACGGHLTPDRYGVLTAQIAPALEGVEITFEIVEGSGAGRAVPAMLSRTRAATRSDGVARTVLLTSDAEETCRVAARVGDTPPLYLVFEFRRTVDGGVVVAPPPAGAAAPAVPADERTVFFASRLADPAVEVRTAAKRMLLSLGRDAVGALVAVAGSPRAPRDARSLAVRTLAELGDEEADDQLLALLGHSLPDVRLGAEEAIARMALARAETLGSMASGADDALVRAAGVRILAALGSVSAERQALLAMSDDRPVVRGTAVWELARGHADSASPATLAALNDPSDFVRAIGAKAVVILGRLYVDEPEPVAFALAGLLEDRSPCVRSAAARALGVLEAGPHSALPASFDDPDVRVRRSAALAIPWRANLRSSMRMLRRLVLDADAVVKSTALGAIAEGGGPAEVDLMIATLDGGDEELRDRAVRALRRVTCLDFGWSRAGTPGERAEVLRHWCDWFASNRAKPRSAWLRQALDLPGSTLRGRAGLELARAQPLAPATAADLRARDALRAELRHVVEATANAEASSERHAAAEGLMLLADESGLDVLRRALGDARRYVRISAVRALAGALRAGAAVASDELGSAALRALVDALEDESVTVRRLAVRALQDATGKCFEFQPQGPHPHRGRAVEAWRAWLRERAKDGREDE